MVSSATQGGVCGNWVGEQGEVGVRGWRKRNREMSVRECRGAWEPFSLPWEFLFSSFYFSRQIKIRSSKKIRSAILIPMEE